MAGMLSGVVLVAALGLVAILLLALVAGLFRISRSHEPGGPDADASERRSRRTA